jgi:predicted secreted hydrolase
MTRLPTRGALTVGGHRFTVSGLTWMDHEFSSNALAPTQTGWDWMGLSFDDGSDLMIYRLRDRDPARDYLSGTRITSDGIPHYLTAADLTLASGDPWKSPSTGGQYPQRWDITCKGMAPFSVRALMSAQELVTPGSTDISYYEGAAQILDSGGHRVGKGYLEMTGYAKPMSGKM